MEVQLISTWFAQLIVPANSFNWTCNTVGSVMHLSLANSNLNGTLDELDFTSLLNLTLLNLDYNLCMDPFLQTSQLCRNSPHWTLATMALLILCHQSGDLSELNDLRLRNNNLVGAIPYQLSNLWQVHHFDLGSNQLEIQTTTSLFVWSVSHLSLYLNYLTLEFPTISAELYKFMYLDLSLNELTGPIPASLTNLVNLEYLNLSYNSFQGPFPAYPTKLSRLRYLRLDNNLIYGSTLKFWQDKNNLQAMNLTNNHLSGEIPSSMGSMIYLESLHLNGNIFIGEFPSFLRIARILSFLILGIIDSMELSCMTGWEFFIVKSFSTKIKYV